jgi:ribosomal 30S subunit maturation factor RimM
LSKQELDFELSDILEEIKINEKTGLAINDEKVIEENIICILKREKLWKKGYMIVFPVGTAQDLDVGSTDDDPSSYIYDFEVFSDLNTVVASGTVRGCLLVYRKSDDPENDDYCEITGLEVVDMDMTIGEYLPKFLDKKEKEVVQFD